MLIDANEDNSAWIYKAVWDMITSMKKFESNPEDLKKYTLMGEEELFKKIEELEKDIGEGCEPMPKKAPEMLNLIQTLMKSEEEFI